ncbi:sucrose-6-phosphate hydrolase [Streptococcus hongkongensis]
MELPKEVRYKTYDQWTKAEIEKIEERISQSPWHCNYHIEAKTGLLNDPNGFSYFDGQYHLFYQNWPFGAAHGLKQWVHMVSKDLVNFTETGTKLLPDHANDSHGAYSGSAYAIDEKLFLFYTGNVRDQDWVRHPLQIGAFMDKNGKIEKFNHALIEQPEDTTDHFRDPQIFQYQEQFYAIIGGQNLNKKGIIKLYKAVNNQVDSWKFVADLNFDNSGTAYMIECPNLVFVDGKPVLIFSPQGLSRQVLNYANIYPNTYQIFESFDPENGKLIGPRKLENLDFGFEAYATQAFNNPDGKALAISWIGLPDINYPSDQFDYQGALSLVKELHIKDGQLYQTPVDAITSLRGEAQAFADKASSSNTYELELQVPANQVTELKVFSDGKGRGLVLTIDTKSGQLSLDRSQVGQQYATDFGTIRTCQIPQEDVTLNIYLDKSTIEIFVNQGNQVLTSRVFPSKEESGISIIKGQVSGNYYEMRK